MTGWVRGGLQVGGSRVAGFLGGDGGDGGEFVVVPGGLPGGGSRAVAFFGSDGGEFTSVPLGILAVRRH
jgi:hypothetical protein